MHAVMKINCLFGSYMYRNNIASYMHGEILEGAKILVNLG